MHGLSTLLAYETVHVSYLHDIKCYEFVPVSNLHDIMYLRDVSCSYSPRQVQRLLRRKASILIIVLSALSKLGHKMCPLPVTLPSFITFCGPGNLKF